MYIGMYTTELTKKQCVMMSYEKDKRVDLIYYFRSILLVEILIFFWKDVETLCIPDSYIYSVAVFFLNLGVRNL